MPEWFVRRSVPSPDSPTGATPAPIAAPSPGRRGWPGCGPAGSGRRSGSSARTPPARGSNRSKRSSGLSQTIWRANRRSCCAARVSSPCSSRSRPSVTSSRAALAPSSAARPVAVEVVEARGDPRAALPVAHLRARHRQGEVGIAMAQRPRDVGQARAEGERVDLEVAPRQAVHVVQHQAGVAVHRAGDVEQDDDRRQLAPRPAEARHQRLGLARHRQHRRAQVDPAARAGGVAAPSHRRERQRHFLGELLGELELGCRHRLEVGAAAAARGRRTRSWSRSRSARRPAAAVAPRRAAASARARPRAGASAACWRGRRAR